MNLKLAGYEVAPQEQYHSDLMDFAGRVANGDQVGNPPMASIPVYSDDAGNHYVGMPSDEGVVAMPFIPGSPAQGSTGGFVPVEQMPQSGAGDELGGLLGETTRAMPAGDKASWLGSASGNGMLAGAPGTGVAGALSTLGLSNPMASGILGGAVAAAGNMAGLGSVGGMLAGAISGGSGGLMNSLGSQGMGALLQASGLGNVPGMSALAGIAGGQLNNLANLLTGGGWADGLNQAAGAINGALGNGAGLGDFVDPNAGKSTPFDPSAIGSQALDGAANQLLSQWKVDDESSAAEQVAHKAVMDNKGAILEAGKNPNAFLERMKAIFSGVSSAAKFPVARMGDLDVKPPYLIQVGVATILAEGKPVSRITDPLTPSGPIILEGAATVLSAGLPTARVTHTTSAPAMKIIQGAPMVLVGGPSAKVDPPAKAPDAENQSNAGPKGPEAPKKPASGSGKGGEGGAGESQKGQAGDSQGGSVGSGDFNDAPNPGSGPSAPGTNAPNSSTDPARANALSQFDRNITTLEAQRAVLDPTSRDYRQQLTQIDKELGIYRNARDYLANAPITVDPNLTAPAQYRSDSRSIAVPGDFTSTPINTQADRLMHEALHDQFHPAGSEVYMRPTGPCTGVPYDPSKAPWLFRELGAAPWYRGAQVSESEAQKWPDYWTERAHQRNEGCNLQ